MLNIEWWHWLIYAVGCIIMLVLVGCAINKTTKEDGTFTYTIFGAIIIFIFIALSWVTILTIIVIGFIYFFKKGLTSFGRWLNEEREIKINKNK